MFSVYEINGAKIKDGEIFKRSVIIRDIFLKQENIFHMLKKCFAWQFFGFCQTPVDCTFALNNKNNNKNNKKKKSPH